MGLQKWQAKPPGLRRPPPNPVIFGGWGYIVDKDIKKKMGRPTILTKEMQDEIVKYVEMGNYLETACDMAGIDVHIVRRWIKAGTRKNPAYEEFSTAIKKASAKAEIFLLSIIDNAAQSGIWQAAAWRLERKFPKKWGRWERDENEVEVTGDGAQQVRVKWIKVKNKNDETYE